MADNLERLKVLFPEAFADGGLDFEVPKQLPGGAVGDSGECCGLNWHGKRRALRNALMPSPGTLRPCPQESVDWETTRNIVIEGDNLEVLKLLQKSCAGEVKLIYIDPPYNTGKDFVHPDDWRDGMENYLALTGQIDGERRELSSNPETSGSFHTDWLNMMYPRLKLARTILCNDGVIVISIDEHEFFNVRNLLNEIFEEENPVSELCVSLNSKGRQLTKFFAISHEYMAITADFCDRFGRPRNIADLTKERLCLAAGKIRNDHPASAGDLGFRVFKLDSSNIRAWDPDPDDLEDSLLAIVNQVKEDRSDDDIFHEILLKFGCDLSIPVETRTIAGKCVHQIVDGLLIICLEKPSATTAGSPSPKASPNGMSTWAPSERPLPSPATMPSATISSSSTSSPSWSRAT